MKHTFNINDKVLLNIINMTGISNKTKLVNDALAYYLDNYKKNALLNSFGKTPLEYKKKEERNWCNFPN